MSYKRIANIILIYFVALAAAYAWATPFFEGPDEAAHFLYVHNLLQSGQLPVLESRDAIFASQSTQRHHPPLYYMAAAALTFWTKRDDLNAYLIRNPLAAIGTAKPNNSNVYLHNWLAPKGDTAAAIRVMRLFSIALSTGTVWLVYHIGKLAYNKTVGLLAMLLTASMPTFIFISATINNDNLVTFLYTAGIYWIFYTWHRQRIAPQQILSISLILSGIALSKVNGLTLFGVVYGALLLGLILKRFALRQVIFTIGASAVGAALLAGWWYMRNFQLYGDPMALNIMRGIWGRGIPPSDLNIILDEAEGVWLSFWYVLGHFNIRIDGWFYTYVTVLAVSGIVMILLPIASFKVCWRGMRRAGLKPAPTSVMQSQGRTEHRANTLILMSVCALVTVSLIFATRQVNVSQGRILFPGISAFTVLVSAGWVRAFRRYSLILLLPLIFTALSAPINTLPTSYRRLDQIHTLPDDLILVNTAAEGIHLHGYTIDKTISPGDTLTIDLYFSGQHPQNPILSIKAITDAAEMGGVDFYPGMTFLSQLKPGAIYHAQTAFTLNVGDYPPQQLDLLFGWYVLDLQTQAFVCNIQWGDAPSLVLPGPVLIDRSYPTPQMAVSSSVRFGDVIELAGYTLSQTAISPGDSIEISLVWRSLSHMDTNWTLAIGLLNDDNQIITQADAEPLRYPTSLWQPSVNFAETRTLTIPQNTPAGTYRLYIGWYNEGLGIRLPLQEREDGLYFFDEPIIVN